MNNLTNLSSLQFVKGSGSPAFSPIQIPGLVQWVKADKDVYSDVAMTIPIVFPDSPIAGWKDQSGQGNNFTQATLGKRPLYQTDVQNGLPSAQFDGVDDVLSSATNALAAQTIFAVCNGLTSTGGGGRLFARHPNAGVFDNGGSGFSYYANEASGVASIGGDVTAASIIILSVASSASLTPYLNGTAKPNFDPASNMTSVSEIYLGADSGNPNDPKDCNMFEFLIYNTALSASNRTLVNSYLATKWGI